MTRLFGDDTFGSGVFGGTTPGASGLAIRIEIDFTTAVLDAPGAWVEVTEYVRSISTRRGRNHELGRTSAGTCSVILDNRDRRFDPLFTSSPYYPNVLPMRHIRIRAEDTSGEYHVFRGFVEDWGQAWPAPAENAKGDAYIDLQAVDAFKVFQLTPIRAYRLEVLEDEPLIYWPLDDVSDLGSLGAPPTLGDGVGTFGRADSPFVSQTSLDMPGTAGSAAINEEITTDILPRNQITMEGWVYLDALPPSTKYLFRLNDPDWPAALAITSGGFAEYQWSASGPAFWSARALTAFAAGAWHHVAVTQGAGRVRLYLDAVKVYESTTLPPSGGPLSTSPTFQIGTSDSGTALNGAAAHVALYGSELTAERIAAHYRTGIDRLHDIRAGDALAAILGSIGWPVGLQALGTGLSTVTVEAGGTVLEALQVIAEDTEHGLLAMSGDGKVTFIGRETFGTTVSAAATFGDAGTETKYRDLKLSYDDQDLWTEVEVSGAEGTVPAFATDATAASTYGQRGLSVSGAAANDAELQDQANGLLRRYKDPHTRPTTLATNREFAQQLGRSLGDRVNVKRRPPASGTISVDALIEGVNHDAGPDQVLATTFSLVPVEETPWLLADATYGVLDSTTDLGW